MANTIQSGMSGRLVALLVASLLLLEPAMPLFAQDAPAAAPPQRLQIVILDGEGALNNIQERTAREPIVQVQDENHKPVAGALVLFAIHGGGEGAGGAFASGATSLSVVTDASGTARAVGLLPNQLKGSWQIHVTASYGKVTTTSDINESNVVNSTPNQTEINNPPPTKPPFHWLLSKPVTIVGGLLVAGVVTAVVVVKVNNNNGTQITTGPGGVGAPTAGGFHIRF
jgi:hypothetical protein